MRAPVSWALLLAIAALAFALRVAPPLEPVGARSTDAYRLRLVELRLATGGAPLSDRFLDAPRGRAVPWPPLHDALLAAVAQRWLADEAGDPALGGVEEPRLERALARAAPWLGVLAVLAVFAAGRALGEGQGRALGAHVAAAAYALSPLALDAEGLGRVDPGALVSVAVALQLGGIGLALKAGEWIDRLTASMFAGLGAGLALSCSVESGLVSLGAWSVLVLASLGRDRETARGARRAGIFLCLVASVVVALPGAPGALASGDAVGRGALGGLSALALLAALPFLVLDFFERDALSTRWRIVAIVAAAAVFGFALFGPGPAPLARLADGAGAAFGSEPLRRAGGLALAAWLAAVVLGAARNGWRNPELRPLGVCVALGLAAMPLLGARAAPALLVPGALLIGRGLASPGGLAPRFAIASLIVLSAATLLGARAMQGEGTARAEIAALRWMRTGTASPGPWNHPAARPDRGVLTSPEWAGRVVYHARRPAVGEGDERALLDVLALDDAARFAVELDRLGAAWVVVSPAMLVAHAGQPLDGALARLALGGADGASAFGLELLHASPETVEIRRSGRVLGGPAVSVLRRVRAPGDRPPARLGSARPQR